MGKRPRQRAKGKTLSSFVVPKRPKLPALMFRPHYFDNKVEVIRQQPRAVFVTRQAYSDMWHFVDIADMEVGWLGTVRVLPSGSLLIEEVFLLKQEVSAAQTEISEEGIALLANDLIQSREDGVDVANRIRFWGHSHVNMGTSPSQQDEDQMKLFEDNECPWFIRGILNKLGRMEFDIFLFENGVVVRDVPWAVYETVDHTSRGRIQAEFTEKVEERTYIAPRPAKLYLDDNFEGAEEGSYIPGKLTPLGYVRFGDQRVLNSELSGSENENEDEDQPTGVKRGR